MQTVLLDALETLVSLQPPGPLLRSQLAERFSVLVSESEAQQAISAEIAFYRAHLDEGRDADSLASLRARCAEVIREQLAPGYERLRSVPRNELTEALLASLHFDPFPDAAPALRELRAARRRVVVVSNWDFSLHDVLGRIGLAPLLDGIMTSAECAARKPAREIFERALALAGAGPAEAIHVGDSLQEDVEGARSAGIVPVLLRRDGAPAPRGITTIESLAELPVLVSRR